MCYKRKISIIFWDGVKQGLYFILFCLESLLQINWGLYLLKHIYRGNSWSSMFEFGSRTGNRPWERWVLLTSSCLVVSILYKSHFVYRKKKNHYFAGITSSYIFDRNLKIRHHFLKYLSPLWWLVGCYITNINWLGLGNPSAEIQITKTSNFPAA